MWMSCRIIGQYTAVGLNHIRQGGREHCSWKGLLCLCDVIQSQWAQALERKKRL